MGYSAARDEQCVAVMPAASEAGRSVRERLATYRLVRNLCWHVLQSGGTADAASLLAAAGIRCEVSAEDLANFPPAGPVLAAVNRPCGVFESLALAAVLPRVRPDVKVFTNYLVANVPGAEMFFIAADPWQSRRAVAANRRAMSQATAWLRAGSLLAVFPAGDRIIVRSAGPEQRAAGVRYRWSTTAPRIARSAGAPVVPVWIDDFVLDSLDPDETPEPGTVIEMRVGDAVPARRLAQFSSHQDAAAFLRWKACLLGERNRPAYRVVPRLA